MVIPPVPLARRRNGSTCPAVGPLRSHAIVRNSVQFSVMRKWPGVKRRPRCRAPWRRRGEVVADRVIPPLAPAPARRDRRPLLLFFSAWLRERNLQSLVLAHQIDNLTELLDTLRFQRVEHDDHMPHALLGEARKTAGDDFRRSRNRVRLPGLLPGCGEAPHCY